MKKKILITGGAGFIGSKVAFYFLGKGHEITIFDNFQRYGTDKNASWLKSLYPAIKITKGDIRNKKEVKQIVYGKDIIFHLAGQVAVTASVADPRSDFEVNALGTLNILEAARLAILKPIIIYSSTNKVYGRMQNVKIISDKNRYIYKDYKLGISESMNLDFHSPYGCSKGAADQYVRDYERIYGIPTVVFRQSCIYGPRQFGLEDQGWLAWFIIALSRGLPITIYGDGKQVRDILYIDDLINAYAKAIDKINSARGKIYNIGGGFQNSISVWKELKPILEALFRTKIKVKYSAWRPGDQKIYISDNSLIEKELGWKPKVGFKEGIEKLFNWIYRNKSLFQN